MSYRQEIVRRYFLLAHPVNGISSFYQFLVTFVNVTGPKSSVVISRPWSHFVQVSVLVSRPKKGIDNNTAQKCVIYKITKLYTCISVCLAVSVSTLSGELNWDKTKLYRKSGNACNVYSVNLLRLSNMWTKWINLSSSKTRKFSDDNIDGQCKTLHDNHSLCTTKVRDLHGNANQLYRQSTQHIIYELNNLNSLPRLLFPVLTGDETTL